jgi:hypothetical protein
MPSTDHYPIACDIESLCILLNGLSSGFGLRLAEAPQLPDDYPDYDEKFYMVEVWEYQLTAGDFDMVCASCARQIIEWWVADPPAVWELR